MARGVGEATWQYRARVIVHAPGAHVRDRLPIPVDVESLGEDKCAFEPGSDHPEMLALYLGLLGADFTVMDSPELVAALRKLARRYQRHRRQPARFRLTLAAHITSKRQHRTLEQHAGLGTRERLITTGS